jgi:hypothetical protein
LHDRALTLANQPMWHFFTGTIKSVHHRRAYSNHIQDWIVLRAFEEKRIVLRAISYIISIEQFQPHCHLCIELVFYDLHSTSTSTSKIQI